MNSGSKLTFSESSYNFLQKIVLACSTHVGYPKRQGALPLKPLASLPAARWAQRVKITMYIKKSERNFQQSNLLLL